VEEDCVGGEKKGGALGWGGVRKGKGDQSTVIAAGQKTKEGIFFPRVTNQGGVTP